MHFAFTDEQEQFRAIVRRFMTARSPTTEVRRLMATPAGCDSAVWRQLCDELGVAGVHVPEALGGQGFGFAELGIALEEMGRALFCAPFFASAVLATQALRHVADARSQATLLPKLASGERIGTLAWVEAGGDWDACATTVTATAHGDHVVIDGAKKFVLDGCSADLVLVVARVPGTRGAEGLGLYAIDAPAAGLAARPLATIDTTRKQAELVFTQTPARALCVPGSAAPGLARALDEAAVMLACEMVGGARALHDQAVEYARLRMQFGRPIGSFQAIKHKLADLLLELELAASAAYYAAAALDEGDAEAPALAAMAKACASDAYMHMAIEGIQIHGGIGFTWDHDTQLWYKRAKTSEVLLGDASAHRERYLAAIEAARAEGTA